MYPPVPPQKPSEDQIVDEKYFSSPGVLLEPPLHNAGRLTQ